MEKYMFCILSLYLHVYSTNYSRGYKNRAIVKKMFEISPIFNGGIECKLFKFMTFFDSTKDLTCMVGPFFSRISSRGPPEPAMT
jgi:hypothetical protein